MSDFQIPDWVCDIIVSMIDDYPFIVLEPTAGKGNLVRAISRKFPSCGIITPEDIDTYEPNGIFIDWVVGNPPFTPMIRGFEILEKVYDWCPKVVMLLPWLLLINSEKRSKWFMDNGLCEVIHLPRKAFKGSRVQTCIVKMIPGFDGDIKLSL